MYYKLSLLQLLTAISIDGVPLQFTQEAEHVGVVRSTAGNLPNVLHRVSEHKKSLGAVLSAGLARGHRGSPAAALRFHQLHCTPVLFSGLASLCLSKSEIRIIDKHYQHTVQNLQKLHLRTPRSIVFLLGGSLPGEAILHLRQLSLFSMICNLPGDPLYTHAKYALTTLSPSSLSWFHQVRDVCRQYHLPHPLTLLEDPMTKNKFKKLAKLRVTEYWQHLLASEFNSPDKSSLKYFDPHKASLLRPHPMWVSSAGNAYETVKSILWAKMVSGRYRSEMLCRFWTTNRSGACLSETCQNVPGTLEHLLIVCPALEHTRHRLRNLWCLKTIYCPPLHRLILEILGSSPEHQVKFILDSTAFPELIKLVQAYGQELQETVLYLTRTYAFAIHRQKQRHLGRWPSNSDKQTRPGSIRPVMTDPETDKNNYLNNNICVAGHPTSYPCLPCTSCPAVPRPGSGAAGATLTIPVTGLAAVSADCTWRSEYSGDSSIATGQHPTPTRHTQSDQTSSVSATQSNVYSTTGAHIPSVVEPVIVTIVGPCEGGRPGGDAQSTALDHQHGVGWGRCGGVPSRVDHDNPSPLL